MQWVREYLEKEGREAVNGWLAAEGSSFSEDSLRLLKSASSLSELACVALPSHGERLKLKSRVVIKMNEADVATWLIKRAEEASGQDETSALENALQDVVDIERRAPLCMSVLALHDLDRETKKFRVALCCGTALMRQLRGVAASRGAAAAVCAGEKEGVRQFVEEYRERLDEACASEDRGTLLWHAAQCGREDIAIMLLTEYKCNVHAVTYDGETAVKKAHRYAVVKGDAKVLNVLLKHGADAVEMADKGSSLLQWQYLNEGGKWVNIGKESSDELTNKLQGKGKWVTLQDGSRINLKHFYRSVSGVKEVNDVRVVGVPMPVEYVTWEVKRGGSWKPLTFADDARRLTRDARAGAKACVLSDGSKVDLVSLPADLRWKPSDKGKEEEEEEDVKSEEEVDQTGVRAALRQEPLTIRATAAAEEYDEVSQLLPPGHVKHRFEGQADKFSLLEHAEGSVWLEGNDLMASGTKEQMALMEQALKSGEAIKVQPRVLAEKVEVKVTATKRVHVKEIELPGGRNVAWLLLENPELIKERLEQVEEKNNQDMKVETKVRRGKIVLELTNGTPHQIAEARAIASRLSDLFHAEKTGPEFFDRQMQKAQRTLRGRLSSVVVIGDEMGNWVEFTNAWLQKAEESFREARERLTATLQDKLPDLMLDAVASPQEFLDAAFKVTDSAIGEEKSKWEAHQDEWLTTSFRKVVQGLIAKAEVSLKEGTEEKRDDVNAHIHELHELLKGSGIWFTSVPTLDTVPRLLKRAELMCTACSLGLPLFPHMQTDVIGRFSHGNVMAVYTSTGSGKSTLLPIVLHAYYGAKTRVVVTQPRRLPCKLVSERVQQTFGKSVSGWRVAGEDHDASNPVVFLTEGLLRQELLYGTVGADIVILDEVHERGFNMDLCIALLAEQMEAGKYKNLKVVLASATMDKGVYATLERATKKKVACFELDNLSPFSVKEDSMVGKHPVEAVAMLAPQLKRGEQLLCFVPSAVQAREYVGLFKELHGGVAHALYAEQAPKEQEELRMEGTVFFATTVAETSLTFPKMRFVVDTGSIMSSQYEVETGVSRLVEKDATVSSQKQRKGRLGRTMPGTYYQLFSKKLDMYPHGSILTMDVVDVEFELLRAGRSLQKMEPYLPEAVSKKALTRVQRELEALEVIHANGKVTSVGELMMKLPVVGGVRQARAVLAGLKEEGCGREMVELSACLMAMGNSVGTVLRHLPGRFRSEDGDFASLLLMFEEVLARKQSIGLEKFKKQLQRAVVYYEKLQQALINTAEFSKVAYQGGRGGWKSVCRALAAGYGSHIFWNRAPLQGPKHDFLQVLPEAIGAKHEGKTVQAQLDVKSLAFRGWNAEPAKVVIARDVRSVSSKREGAILSLVGVVDPSWLRHRVVRRFVLGPNETPAAPFRVVMQGTTKLAEAAGAMSTLYDAEVAERKRLVQQNVSFDLRDAARGVRGKNEKEWEENLNEASSRQLAVFRPLILRWRNVAGVDVTLSNQVVKIENGREQTVAKVKAEFQAFCEWVARCNVVKGPNHSMHPRQLNPEERKQAGDMEERIKRIADGERTRIDIWKSVQSSEATRESRMEVVAWLAVTQFGAKVEGGFVRDWVVGGRYTRPASGAKHVIPARGSDAWKTQGSGSWIWLRPQDGVPETDVMLTPADLDMHLPLDSVFDAGRFMDELFKLGFSVDYVRREGWRYSMILDLHKETGPFNLDLIEPHAAIAHDMLDFDVNNLFVTKGYTNALGMRVNLNNIGESDARVSLSLESIVQNIRNKNFTVLRHKDPVMEGRCQKMRTRGWSEIGSVIYVPNRGDNAGAVFSVVPSTDEHYQRLVQQFAPIGTIKKIEHISSANNDDLYDAMKKTIRRECGGTPNAENECFLFHGTKGSGLEGIPNNGFDNRYWTKPGGGNFGHGAYFADDPRKSNEYTDASGKECVIFLCKVLLGKVEKLNTTKPDAVSPSQGYHSINGTNGNANAYQEYIIYRYGQAKPHWKITYMKR